MKWCIIVATVFIKIGGSFITYKDKPFSIDYSALYNTYKIIAGVYREKNILIGHGGGSFAHPIVKAMEKSDPAKTIVLCQKATRLLNNVIVNYLVDYGLPVVSIQTSVLVYHSSSGYKVAIDPLAKALEYKLVPIVYGECIYCEKDYYRVLSTEELFKVLVPFLKPEYIVFIERVSGVYTRDPLKYRDAERIPLINRENYREILDTISGASGVDVTGGIKSKIEYSIELARKYGIKSIIISGFDVGECIRAILYGETSKGTVITW